MEKHILEILNHVDADDTLTLGKPDDGNVRTFGFYYINDTSPESVWVKMTYTDEHNDTTYCVYCYHLWKGLQTLIVTDIGTMSEELLAQEAMMLKLKGTS